MPLVSSPDRRFAHATGYRLDQFCFELNSGIFLQNFPALPVGFFTFDGTTWTPGSSFIFSGQEFTVINTGGYNGQEIDLTNSGGGGAIEQATNFYGAMISNPFIAANATITGPTLVGVDYLVTIQFNSFIEYGPDFVWFDDSSMSSAMNMTGSAGVLPIYDTTARATYQLLLENGTPITEVRKVFSQADDTGGERNVTPDFAGELTGLLYVTLPSTTGLSYMDVTFFRMVKFRYGAEYMDTDCNLLGGTTEEEGPYMVVGSASQDFDDWELYHFDGVADGTQKFLTRRPQSMCTSMDQSEWISIIVNANQYNIINGSSPPTYNYTATYTNNLAQTDSVNIGVVNGVWRFPSGGFNMPASVTSDPGVEWVDIQVEGADIFGGGTDNISEVYRVRICNDLCGDDERDIYFPVDLGNFDCLRFKKIEDREVGQGHEVFYRPFQCGESLPNIRQDHGNRSYGHVSTREVTYEYRGHYTPELGLFVRSFRAANAHYIIEAVKATIEWRYLILNADSIIEYQEGERLVFQATFTYHLPINNQRA